MFDEETMPDWMKTMRGVGRFLFATLIITKSCFLVLCKPLPGVACPLHILKSTRYLLRGSNCPRTSKAHQWDLPLLECLQWTVFIPRLPSRPLVPRPLA